MSPDPITSRRQAEEALISRAQQDDAFRRELLANPSAAISSALGVDLPSNLEITVLEETPDSVYLVIPAASGSGELAEHELAAVAGGAEVRDDSNWGKIGGIFGGGGPATNPANPVGNQQNQL